MTAITQAREAAAKIAPFVSKETRTAIEGRLRRWEKMVERATQTPETVPQLVMRPGLPPRPLNKHYFTVVRSYE